MACYAPLQAIQTTSGEVRFFARGSVGKNRAAADDVLRELSLPCGQCIGCRLERSRQWAVRCMHESQMHEFSVFITLTYDDANCPISLDYRHFQLFMKRLRKSMRKSVRFYMCGEYGEQFGRPHFHACLFGCFFADRKLYRRLPSGSNLWTSSRLSELWPYGFSSIGDVTFESAAYVARYITKKVTGSGAERHYRVVDGETGEIVDRVPEFCHMSLKPGIGATWFAKYQAEVFPRDEVVMRGRQMRPPKFYDELLKREDSFVIDEVQFARYERAIRFATENTEDRLAVRHAVAAARLKTKLRTIV